MKFDLTAAKAYVGGVLAVAAVPVAGFVVGLIHAGTGFDIPTGVSTVLTTGLAYAFAHVAVYFVPNKTV